MIFRTRILAAVFLLIAPVAHAQVPDDAELQAIVDAVYAEQDVPALGAAIVTAEGAQAIAVTGERARGSGVAVTESDLWHIGSDTKAMTATLLARLAEEGMLSFDEILADLLPDLAGDMHPQFREATLAQLLSHTAGTEPNPGPLRFMALRHGDTPSPERRMNLARYTLSEAPAFPPGTGFQYSNSGYVIAGAIAEQATGLSWEHLIDQYVFTPLGMESTGFGPPASGDDYVQPRGHHPGLMGGRAVASDGPAGDNPAAFGPAGTVHLSLADWAAFAAEHLRGEAGEGALLSAESYARLHAPASPDGDYALGWGVAEVATPDGPTRALRHTGSNTMWFAIVELWPDRDVGFLVVTNDGTPHGNQAARALSDRLRTELAAE